MSVAVAAASRNIQPTTSTAIGPILIGGNQPDDCPLAFARNNFCGLGVSAVHPIQKMQMRVGVCRWYQAGHDRV